MLWTEKNKTHPGGLGQLFPFISGHQNPSGSFENLGCWRCPPSRLHWRTVTQTSLASLLKAEALAHTTAVAKLRAGWISLHLTALCRVSTSRHGCSAARAPAEPQGALQGSSAWDLPSGHQEPITGGNCSAPGVKAHKNVKAPGLDSQYPITLASVFHHDGP